MIVDESASERESLRRAFETHGFSALSCSEASEVQEILRREPVRLLVLDVRTGANGEGLTRAVRAQFSRERLAIVLLSTQAEAGHRIRGMRGGADEYIGKPIDAGFVVARARELLGQPPAAGAESPILIIDDSSTARGMLREKLQVRGHRVRTAASAEDGLRLAAAHRPSAIIVAAASPAMDGPTVVRRIRLDAALRGTPCLLVTESHDEDSEQAALDAGADDFARRNEAIDIIVARASVLLRRAWLRPTQLVSLAGPQRVLIVDPWSMDQAARAHALRADGFDVALAHSETEALDLLAVQSVHCILLEWGPGAKSSAECCGRLKTLPCTRDIPLLVLSTHEASPTLLDALGQGADDVIAGSAAVDVLLARVRGRLRRRQFEDESRHLREELIRNELQAVEENAEREIAEARSQLSEGLERKNRELAAFSAEASAARQLVESASRAKSEFLLSMSHELRTPLNAILGFAQLLSRDRREPLSERHQQRVGHILEGGKHLLRLIEDILDLSRIEAGGVSISIQGVDVMSRIREVLASLAPLAGQRALSIEVECALAKVPPIAADPTRLFQILMNLGSNAIKYNRSGGKIIFAVSLPNADQLRVRVQDTGIGIPDELQDRLFQPFQRMGHETGTIEGSGIGLVVTRQLARRMRGDIGFHSVSGVGSEFWVDLPLHRASA